MTDELRGCLERDLPHPEVAVEVLVPYDRGDLVSRVHATGEVLSVEHIGTGTRLRALVPPPLAGELEQFTVAPLPTR